MFIQHFKASPDQFVLLFRAGAVRASGRGVSLFYNPSLSTLMVLPAVARDAPFIFTEATANFQDVTLQGSVVYRVVDPAATADRFDFSIVKGAIGDGEEKLLRRIVNIVHAYARAELAHLTLEDVLKDVGALTRTVARAVATDAAIAGCGVAVEALHFASARATPEVQKALQTEYREKLQREADQAIYARRSAAVENERQIKERELATEIELSNRRKELVDTDARNTIILAEAQSKAEEMKLGVYRAVPPDVLATLALKSWADAGGAVSNLTITPDMLTALAARFVSRKEL